MSKLDESSLVSITGEQGTASARALLAEALATAEVLLYSFLLASEPWLSVYSLYCRQHKLGRIMNGTDIYFVDEN